MRERIKRLLIVIVEIVSIIGCAANVKISAQQVTTSQLDMAQIRILERDEKPQEALELVEAYLINHEYDVKAKQKQAELYLLQENYTRAVEILNELIANDFNQKSYFILRSRAYYNMERDQLALEDAEKAIDLGYKGSEAYFIKAEVLRKQGKYEEALAYYDKIAPARTKMAAIQYGRAECLYALGSEIEAEIFYEKAYKLAPDCLEYYGGVVKACFSRGYYKKICDLSNAYIKCNRSYGNAYCYKGMAAYKLGRYLEAVDAFGQALCYCDYTADIYYQRCKVYLKLGEKDKAYHDLIKSAKEDQKYVSCFEPEELELLKGYKDYESTIGVLLNQIS